MFKLLHRRKIDEIYKNLKRDILPHDSSSIAQII